MVVLSRHDRLSVKEAADEIGVSEQTIWRWLRKGVGGRRLESSKIGGRRWILRAAIAVFVEQSSSVVGDVVSETAPRDPAIRAEKAEPELS